MGLMSGLVSRCVEGKKEGNRKGSLSGRRRKQGGNLKKKRRLENLENFWEGGKLEEIWGNSENA